MSPFKPEVGRDAIDDAVREAMSLIVRVRDDDPKATWRHLEYLREHNPWLLTAAVVTLAAAVPDDKPMSELLAWTDSLHVKPAIPDLSPVHPQTARRSFDGTRCA